MKKEKLFCTYLNSKERELINKYKEEYGFKSTKEYIINCCINPDFSTGKKNIKLLKCNESRSQYRFKISNLTEDLIYKYSSIYKLSSSKYVRLRALRRTLTIPSPLLEPDKKFVALKKLYGLTKHHFNVTRNHHKLTAFLIKRIRQIHSNDTYLNLNFEKINDLGKDLKKHINEETDSKLTILNLIKYMRVK